MIKDFLKKKLAEASVAKIEIEHSENKLNIIIESARPGLIIGRGGGGVDALESEIKKHIKRKLKMEIHPAKSSPKGGALSPELRQLGRIKIEIREVKNPWISAALVAQMASQQIEKRIPFRQVLKKTLDRVMTNREVNGVRMEVAGRLNGVEIARREWLADGRMPRNSIRANIDYAQEEARCTYGKIGVKVWIYKGERFD